MPVVGPRENPLQVDKAYEEIMALLKDKYYIQNSNFYGIMGKQKGPKERELRNSEFKEALRRLFELDSWEGW